MRGVLPLVVELWTFGSPGRLPTSNFSKCWASPPHLAKVGLRQRTNFVLGSTSVTRRPYVSSWPFCNGVVRFADIIQHRRQSIEVEMVRGRHDTLLAHFMELRCNQKRRSHKKTETTQLTIRTLSNRLVQTGQTYNAVAVQNTSSSQKKEASETKLGDYFTHNLFLS
jgi:hypothetical protein